MRYFMDISYHGGDFHGWQSQDNAYTVQQSIEEAFAKILGIKIPITGSGRTDTGVHARQQIAHFDMEKEANPAKLAYQLNAVLPKSVSVNYIAPVTNEAHARFDAVSRKYDYYIHTGKDPFKDGLSYYFKPELRTDLIAEACAILKSEKDFESFSRVKTEVNNFFCDIYEADWQTVPGGYQFTIKANRFLRGMVRAIVGTLIDVGLSKLSVADFALIVRKKDRKAAGAAAPPHGLFLSEVIYPNHIYTR